MRPLALVALLAFSANAPAQAPAQEPAPKPRPPLKLNLDDVEPERPRITFDPRDDKKKDDKKKQDAANLPGLGGPATNTWEKPSSSVFPQNTGGAEGPVR